METQPSPLKVGVDRTVNSDGGEETRRQLVRPWLGPWVVTLKI